MHKSLLVNFVEQLSHLFIDVTLLIWFKLRYLISRSDFFILVIFLLDPLLGHLFVKLQRRTIVIAEDATITVTRQLLLVITGSVYRWNMEARDDVTALTSEDLAASLLI